MRQAEAGVLYAVFGRARYRIAALCSILSLRKHAPDLPVAVCTDAPAFFASHKKTIDHIIPVANKADFRGRWVRDKFARLESLKRTPFEYTLYVDCDTRVHSPDVSGFPSLLSEHEIGFVECSAANSFACRTLERRMYNAGVILYRKTKGVGQLFATWQSLCAAYHKGSGMGVIDFSEIFKNLELKHQRHLLGMDQIPLMHLLSPEANMLNLKHASLPEAWNLKRRQFEDIDLKKAIISHHSNYVRQAEELLASDLPQ